MLYRINIHAGHGEHWIVILNALDDEMAQDMGRRHVMERSGVLEPKVQGFERLPVDGQYKVLTEDVQEF